MTRLPILSALSIILFLGACGSASETPQAGQYQQVTKVTSLEFPGITDAQKSQMKSGMEQAANSGTNGMFCMDDDDSGQWKNASQQMAKSLGGTCRTQKDAGSETKLDLAMTCTGTASGDVDITMTGTANTEGYKSDIAFNISDAETQKQVRIEMTMSAKRVGECAG